MYSKKQRLFAPEAAAVSATAVRSPKGIDSREQGVLVKVGIGVAAAQNVYAGVAIVKETVTA
jgi:hypothetical protein